MNPPGGPTSKEFHNQGMTTEKAHPWQPFTSPLKGSALEELTIKHVPLGAGSHSPSANIIHFHQQIRG